MTAALEIEDVSKVFRLFRERPSSLNQRVLSGRMRAEDFWALRDIAFEVQEGSSLGLIGHNGSGKTTLLKCIAGILRPTSGVIRIAGGSRPCSSWERASTPSSPVARTST